MLLLLFWFPSLLLLMCQLVSKQILLMTSSLHETLHREKSVHLNRIVPPNRASYMHDNFINMSRIFIIVLFKIKFVVTFVVFYSKNMYYCKL